MSQRQEQARPGRARERPMSVWQAVHTGQHVLKLRLPQIWVAGEIASLSRPASGHLYFELIDRRSRLRAVMFRSEAQRLKFRIENGQALRCHGRLTIYEPTGQFQYVIQFAEPAGLGADALALEQLKRKLAAEGLFDPARKRPLPRVPRRIGVVTSKSGAAVRDIIRTVHMRFPVPILIADANVQGAAAPREIVSAIRALARTDVSVMIIGRGGGSASDLAAFNQEIVVRAIAACPVPTISAVGHEIDISLSDLAADHRAATPTMAGEMAVPVLAELADALGKETGRLHREMRIRINSARQQLDGLVATSRTHITAALTEQRRALGALRTQLEARHPRAQLAAGRAELTALDRRLDAFIVRAVERSRHELTSLVARLTARLPDAQVAAGRAELTELDRRLDVLARRAVERSRHELAALVARLDALSPLKVLQRGYAIASSGDQVLTDADAVAAGDAIAVRLARGTLDCRVESVRDHSPVVRS